MAQTSHPVGDRTDPSAFTWLARHASLIVQHSGDAIIKTTPNGLIESCNPAAQRLLGCTAVEVRGTPVARFMAHDAVTDPAVCNTHWYRADGVRLAVSVSRITDADGTLYIVRRTSACDEASVQLLQHTTHVRRLYETTPALLLSLDMQGQILTVSDLWLERLGLTRHQVIGRPLADFLAPDSGEPFRQRDLRSCFEHGRIDGLNLQFSDQEGGLMEVLASATLEVDECGNAVRCVAVLDDVTLRRKAERRLQHEQARLGNILAGTRAGTLEWNLDTGQTHYNESWAQLYGLHADELGARNIQDWIALAHPDDVARYHEQIRRHLSGELPAIEIEARIRHRDGHWVWVQDRAKVFKGEDGSSTRWIAGIRIDVSERKHAESQLAEAESRSHAVLDLLRDSIESLEEAFALYDPQDRLVVFNQPYKRLFTGLEHLLVNGTRFEEIISQALALGQYPEARDCQSQWLQDRMHAHANPGGEIIQRFADGRVMRVMERRTPSSHTVVSVSDITNLVRATDEARTASQAKSRFLANMSHEIRTPMNAVIGMLALLQRTELTEQQVDYAQKANRSARSLLRLLDDILDFSKIEAGKLALELREFSLDGLLQELAVILDVMAQGKAFRVMFDIDPCLPDRLVGDAMRLQQILVNLAANAVKFTERGEITLRLALQGESAGRATLALSVQDTGIGIAAENLPLVFGAFTQAEASTTRRFGGTGLGLSICRHLARMMDSELLLESRLGQGSRFHFTLSLPVPANTQRTSIAGRHDVSRLAREPHPAQPVPVSSAARLAGLRVLVAEDNATNRQVVQELLALEGAIVTLVNDGQDAVNLLARRPLAEPDFDVVLMDLQMPVMDGITATRRIRDISHLARPPVVAMTANVLETERKACLDAGMNAHVGKPFDLDHLVDVLRTQAGVVSPASAQAVTPIICAATAAPLRELTSKARACGGMGGHASAACGQVQAGQTCSSISIASAAGVDMSEAVQRVGDRCDVYARMLEAFMADLDDLQAALTLPATALARKNQARAAHTLKGAAAMVGATRLSAAAADAERVLNADGAKDLCALSLGRVCQMLDECRPGLRALLASLHERGPSLDAPHHATRLDRSALRDAMVGLSEQLRHFDMGAVETMSRLQTEFCTAGQWLSPVNDAITMLDFDRAALLCDKVLQEPLA